MTDDARAVLIGGIFFLLIFYGMEAGLRHLYGPELHLFPRASQLTASWQFRE